MAMWWLPGEGEVNPGDVLLELDLDGDPAPGDGITIDILMDVNEQ